MRIFTRLPEALGEIQRDLKEMGIKIHPQTYQDKYVADDPSFDAYELQDYIYRVTKPIPADLNALQPWADAEFAERLDLRYADNNPGMAWMYREQVWRQFLQEDGTFAYTYGERIHRPDQLRLIIERLKADPDSRQAFMGIWDPDQDITKLGGVSRVPCTLGYYFQIRQGQLNMTYLQRSADYATHFTNDIYLAVRMQAYIADRVGVPVGYYTHWLGSLHVFAKDVKDVF